MVMPIPNAAGADALLNEHQQRHLLSSCQHIDKLLGDIEQIVHSSASRSVFPRYTSTLTAVQKRVAIDYVARIRERLLAALRSQHVAPRPRTATMSSPSARF